MNGELSPEARAILVETAKRQEEIRKRKPPPKWQSWAVTELKMLREYGPLYQPSQWFGNGHPLPEKARVRFLRALHDLADRGCLVRGVSDGGRTQSIKLTDAGLKLAAELAGEPGEAAGSPEE